MADSTVVQASIETLAKNPDESLCTWVINAPPSGQFYDVTINSDDVSLNSGSIYTWLDSQKPENSMKELDFSTNKKIIIQFEGYDKSDRSEFEIIWSLKEVEKFDISKVVGSCSKTFSLVFKFMLAHWHSLPIRDRAVI